MPEGLKIVVGADVTQANQALASLDKQIDLTGVSIKSFDLTVSSLSQRVALFGGGVNRFATSFRPVPPAIDKATTSLKKFGSTSSSATQASINLGRVIQDAPFGFLGIANNLNPLLESFQRLRASSGSTGGAMKALGSSLVGAGGLGLALSVVSTGLILFGDKLFGTGRAAKAAKEANEELAKSLVKDAASLTVLVGIVQNVNTASKDRADALKAINEQYGKYLPNMETEKVTAENIAKSYDLITDALIRQAVVKGVQDQIAESVKKTAEEIVKLEVAEEKRRIASEKIPKVTKVQINALDQYQKTIKDGQLAQIGQTNELMKAGQGAFSYEERVKRLTQSLKDQLAPLLNLTTKFGDLDVKLKDVKLDKIKQDFFNPLMNLLQRVPFTISDVPVDIGRLNLIQIQSDKLKTFKELVEEKIEKQLEGLVVKPELKIKIVTDRATIAAAQLSADVSAAISKGIQEGATEGFATIGEALGTALSGGDLQGVFKGFVNTIGGLLQSIGKQIIAIGVAAILAKEALAVLFENPFVAIAAGVALVAAGAALKGVLNKGVKGFAAGGLVSGPQLALIGEGSGTSRSNPEVVAPLDKLRSMLTGLTGGGRQMVYVTGRLRGRDMILQNARTSRSQRRTTGR